METCWSVEAGEYKVGPKTQIMKFGKRTLYSNWGKIHNQIFEGYSLISSKDISHEPENAYYSKEGVTLKAKELNWRKYIE